MNLSHRIQKPAEFVYGYLTDMDKFVSVHPVIHKMDERGNGNYLVYETLKLGFIPFSFTYPATIQHNSAEGKVVMRATVFRLTKIEMRFFLKTENNFTIVEEEIEFKSPLPIKSLMQSIFRKQHAQLFRNIELK
ncbi:MAG: SRPBCC family protein [Bacteroidia bacterium]|nr:SRPBCC family protein [Bacteroidia bacterium]